GTSGHFRGIGTGSGCERTWRSWCRGVWGWHGAGGGRRRSSIPGRRSAGVAVGEPGVGVGAGTGVDGAEAREVEQGAVRELRRLHLADRAEDVLGATWLLPVPVGQHRLDRLALQVLLRAAQVAGQDGERALSRIVG